MALELRDRREARENSRTLRDEPARAARQTDETRVAALPREEVAAEQTEQLIDAEPDETDDGDGGVHVVEVTVALLLVDEGRDAGFFTDELGDDEVGPRPADEDAHVAIERRERARDHDVPNETGARGAERLRGVEQRRIDRARGVGDDEHHLEEGADEDDGDFRLVREPENRDGQRSEHRGRHVPDEIDERLEQAREERERSAQNAEWNAEDRRPQE